MLLNNELKNYLLDGEDECKEKLNILIKQMAEQENVKNDFFKNFNEKIKNKCYN